MGHIFGVPSVGPIYVLIRHIVHIVSWCMLMNLLCRTTRDCVARTCVHMRRILFGCLCVKGCSHTWRPHMFAPLIHSINLCVKSGTINQDVSASWAIVSWNLVFHLTKAHVAETSWCVVPVVCYLVKKFPDLIQATYVEKSLSSIVYESFKSLLSKEIAVKYGK